MFLYKNLKVKFFMLATSQQHISQLQKDVPNANKQKYFYSHQLPIFLEQRYVSLRYDPLKRFYL
jgi:hypothetical protein